MRRHFECWGEVLTGYRQPNLVCILSSCANLLVACFLMNVLTVLRLNLTTSSCHGIIAQTTYCLTICYYFCASLESLPWDPLLVTGAFWFLSSLHSKLPDLCVQLLVHPETIASSKTRLVHCSSVVCCRPTHLPSQASLANPTSSISGDCRRWRIRKGLVVSLPLTFCSHTELYNEI